MKEILKKIGAKCKDIMMNIFAGILTVILFPVILGSAIVHAIQEKKLHLIAWDIHDSYQDLVDIPTIFFCFILIITIPIAYSIIKDRDEYRKRRAEEWERQHPGKKA